jgi:hypothetical protein
VGEDDGEGSKVMKDNRSRVIPRERPHSFSCFPGDLAAKALSSRVTLFSEEYLDITFWTLSSI